jgi:putative acetyltransferase
MTALQHKQHLIIEGCYILPHLVHDFDDSYAKEIIHLFLGFSKEYIRGNYEDIFYTHAKIAEDRGHTFSETVDEYIKQNRDLKDECKKCNCKYFEIKENYLNELQDVYSYIDNSIK